MIKTIDFKLLKEQKEDLLKVIDQNNDVKINNSLQGILHMIDSIQDYAVDVLDKDEKEVFNIIED